MARVELQGVTAYLMSCGHMVNYYRMETGSAVLTCATCGLSGYDNALRKLAAQEGLEGRTSRCHECGRSRPSSWQLAAFRHFPERENDTHFCGCQPR